MKRFFSALILFSMIFTSCGTLSDDTSSTFDVTSDIVSEVVSEETSSIQEESSSTKEPDDVKSSVADNASSSGGTSSSIFNESPSGIIKETSSTEDVLFIKEIDGVKYYDVKTSGADKEMPYLNSLTGKMEENHSKYFPEDAQGYYLEDMTFFVDEETFYRVLSKPCKGTGSIKWIGFKEGLNWASSDRFDGVLPVEKMNDPLYVYMCKPSEAPTVMGRVNASNLSPIEENFIKVCTIGAIYNNSEKPIPDDVEFTICLGRTTIILYTEEKGWHIAQETPYPARPTSIFYLPWTLQSSLGVMKLSEDRIKMVDDHWEIKMTGAYLNGADGKDKGATGSVLHYWSENFNVENAKDVKAIVTSYECWIKEPELADYVVAAVGADWRDGKEVFQGFSGHNYTISTEPRVIYGHNLGPQNYDKIMDTEKVQELLGLK